MRKIFAGREEKKILAKKFEIRHWEPGTYSKRKSLLVSSVPNAQFINNQTAFTDASYDVRIAALPVGSVVGIVPASQCLR